MAAAGRLPLLLLLLLLRARRAPGLPGPDAARRFSEHKLCADAECSMLMYRGEAIEDFTGPDCRFVNFKKGDDVYVYYKLAGGAPEVWAGIVGHFFGYFPKDFIRVTHEYTEEELKVPADETDFVCFDGGTDDFDNYNIEELLGFLKLSKSATGDSEKVIDRTSQHVENPEVPEDSDPDSDSAEANAQESESELSKNSEELKERHEAQKNPPDVNSQIDDPQGNQPSLEHFEEMLRDKLKVPESKNNKTSNSSQVADEQEKIDTYKLLKTEMTLDLKTKLGSTADALVSDDEPTRLVTSLEDDFEEDLDDEYYVVEKEEENQENFDELPLLTFTDEEDLKTPLESGVEKYSTDKEQNSSEEDPAEVTQPPGIKNDAKATLAAWEDGSPSTVTEGEQQVGVDLENSSSEEQEGDDASIPDSKWGKPPSATGHVDSEKAEEGLRIVGGLETNKDKAPEVDTEPPLRKGQGRMAQESKTDLVWSKKEDDEQEGRTRRGSAQGSGDLDSPPAPEQAGAAWRPAFGHTDGDPQGPVVRVSKETPQDEKPGERLWDSSSESGSEPEAAGTPRRGERLGQEGRGVAAPSGDEGRNVTSPGPGGEEEEADVWAHGPAGGPKPAGPPEGPRRAEPPGAAPSEDVSPPLRDPKAGGDDGEDEEDHGDEDEDGGHEEDGPEGLLEDENAAGARRAAEGGPGAANAAAPAAGLGAPGGDPGPAAGGGAPRADGPAQRPGPADPEDQTDHGPEGRPGEGGRAGGGRGAALRGLFRGEPAPQRLRGRPDARALEPTMPGPAGHGHGDAPAQDTPPRDAPAQDTPPRDGPAQDAERARQQVQQQVQRAAKATSDAPGWPGLGDSDAEGPTHDGGDAHDPGEDTAPEAGEVQPPLEENVPQENTDDLQMQNPEGLGLWDQPTTNDVNVSDVSEKPDTEEAVDPGIITTDSSPVDAADGKKQPETNADDEPASVTPLENAILLIYSSMYYLTKTLVATLPDDVQPGRDFYGLPWKPVLITAFLGIVSFVVFFWRTILVVKNRVYQVTEQQISEKLKNISKENAELVQKLSDYEQKIKESKKHVQETKKQNMILSDEAIKFKDKIRKLEETNESLNDTAKSLRVMLDSERDQNAKNQDLILENKKSLEKLKDVIAMNSSELSEVQIALNEAKLSEEKVKSECHRVQEENTRLKKKKEQLQQEIKDWSKSHAELSEQIRSFETCQKDLEVALTHKDNSVNALTNCITQLNRLDCDSESEGQNKGGNESDELANGEVGGGRSEKVKNQIKQMMDISRTQTAISVVEEDLRLLQLKLRASMSTKCNLEDQIKKLEGDRDSLQSAKAGLEDECKTLRQKVEILNELYQQKEMALQKKLSQEEYERQEREQRLSAADEKALLATEEVKTYKRRIEEMEDELQKTERAFKTQIATHEKKAHDNWLKARAAERAMAEEKREAANLRHKLLELTQKMAMLQEEPVIVKPMPGRPSPQNPPRRGPLSQNGSFGPSPVSGGECSPPPDPPGRPPSATLGRGDVPRRELGSADGPPPRPRWPEAPGKPSASEPVSGAAPLTNSSSRSSSPSKAMDEGKVTAAAKGPPPFPGVPLLSSPVGGPLLPPIRYGPPPQLCGPFGPRPLPPPFGPGFRPPLGLREYAPGVPPGPRDLPLDPRDFLPGHAHFRPLGPHGPREYFFPGPRLPAPAHGPQEYPPPPGARDAPPPAPQSRSQDSSPALKQSP